MTVTAAAVVEVAAEVVLELLEPPFALLNDRPVRYTEYEFVPPPILHCQCCQRHDSGFGNWEISEMLTWMLAETSTT